MYKEITAAAKKIAKDSKKLLHITRIKTEADEKTGRKASDFYYIINGYYMVKVDAAIYNMAIRPAAPAFIELEAGEGASRHDSTTALPEKCTPIKVLDVIPKDRGEKLTDTGFMSGGINAPHIYDGGSFKVAFNNNYLEMLSPFIQGDLYGSSALTPAQCDGLTDPNALTGALVLPVRLADAPTYQVVRADELQPKSKTEREARADARAEIEKAQKEAAEIIEKAKKEACKINSDISSKVKQDAQKDFDDMKQRGADAIKKAEEEADAIKEAAKAEADAIIKEARAEAVTTLKAAKDEREKIKAGARDNEPEEVKPEEPKQEAKKARLVRNEEKHGLELYFAEVPRAAIRNALKAGGYRWHVTKKCWYAKATPKAEALANKVI